MIPDFVILSLWLLAALAAALARLRRRAIGAVALASMAALLSSLHWWHWNKPIYLAGKQWLADSGAYADRLWVKLAIGAVVLVAAVILSGRIVRWLRRWPVGVRIGGLAAGCDLLYIALRTVSIDSWMPEAIALEPGKSVFSATLASLALGTAWFGRATGKDSDRRQQDDGAFFLG